MNTNEILKSFDKILTVVISSYLILLLLFGVVLFLTSCENDVHTREIEVKYDSEDNIVKMEGQWVQSINLDTWEPANDSFGIWHNSNFLFIKSNKYKIIDVEVFNLIIEVR